MNIFVSYKQTGVSDQELTEKLGKVREVLSGLGHNNFIYFFDTDFKNQTSEEIISDAKNEIVKSDLVLAFVDDTGRSEGILLELGIAFGLNKKILFLVNNKQKEEYFLSYGIAHNTLFFDDFSEIEGFIRNNI
ncbi:hypothetical protein A9Q91_02875 [Candidatus Gracilibacteria bacterium 28_42_T64]|nr:hypothetical protein A9Q91_02875 [Candidatus Gracilibacteria bacterium 28_42_T64]